MFSDSGRNYKKNCEKAFHKEQKNYYFVENYLFNCINKDHHWNQGIIKLTNESRDTSIAFFVGYALINIESNKFTC